MILRQFPPMVVYETLFSFVDATGQYMGDSGTHPWAQGYPLTVQIPGGPTLPDAIEFDASDLKYPKATEYTPYYDVLPVLDRTVHLIKSDAENKFRPGESDYNDALPSNGSRVMLVKSNPCNPSGVTLHGENLRHLLDRFSTGNKGALIDEAYEFFCDPEPQSALQHIDNIDETNIFVVGAATKGLQVPGMRIGWAIASREHIEIFRNYSSFGMGGVSRASQIYVAGLLEQQRVKLARVAVCRFYSEQRRRYADGLEKLGFELFTGTGGFVR